MLKSATDFERLNEYFLSVTVFSVRLGGADTRLLDLVGVSHLLVGLRLELVFVVDILGSVRGEDISSFVVAMTSDGDETLPSTFCVWHGIGFSCFLLGLWKLRNLKKI